MRGEVMLMAVVDGARHTSNHRWMRFRIGLGVIGAVCLMACEKPKAEPEKAPAANPAEVAADDVVRTLRALYPIARVIGRADFTWATCHDTTVGYDALLKCEHDVERYIREAAAKAAPAPFAALPCGKDLEDAQRRYITGQRRFHTDHLAWLISQKAKLSAPMANQAQHAACKIAQCDDEPNVYADKFASDFAQINSVACVEALFDCSPPGGIVCNVSKVVNRLGLGDSLTRQALAIKATGRAID
jgi:hypothetical protein